MTLIWSPLSARLNVPGRSIDLGAIKRGDAEIKAWLMGARLVIKDAEPPSQAAQRGT